MTQVRIEAAVLPLVSYAMAHNGISPIQSLTLHNDGGACEAAELQIVVQDAQGTLSRSYSRALDLAANATLRLTEVGLMLAPEVMDDVEEDRLGTLRIRVSHAGAPLGEQELPIRILAAHHWLAKPPGLGIELLAAHVMPNAPQISAVLPEVGELLRSGTGVAAIDGYQSGDPGKVDAIVAACFDALRQAGITYAEPPASWSAAGQKVRTPAEVIEGRLGTCLDTCVVLAATLEQAGIRPQIWLLEGHALLGYWRDEITYPSAASTEIGELLNQIDLGQLNVVETTMLTSADGDFRAAVQQASRRVHSEPSSVIGVLDVYAARRARILPLPAVTRVDGAVQVVEYHPATHSTAPADRAAALPAPDRPQPGQKPVPARITQWKNSLLDLGLRNRLINFSRRSGVHLHLDPAILHDLEDDLSSHRQVTLLPSDAFDDTLKARHGIRTAGELPQEALGELYRAQRAVFSDIPGSSYVTRLRSLAYKARTIQEETGANNLYLALGNLVWELDGRQLRSPLVLIPLALKTSGRGGSTYQFLLDEAGQSTPNFCLLEKLRQTFGLDVPGLANPVMDAAGIDLQAAFTSLRRGLASKGLPFHVEDTADIAILQFAKYRLWKDIDESWEKLMGAPMVRHLALTPTEEFVDPVKPVAQHPLDELATTCPIPADGSQLTAIAEALAGRTLVLEGPPGTGKSQTIANLLAGAIATGKRVLFVAEKRAALDVVRSRVDAVGLGAFTLDLHDKLSKPARVRQQIAHALDLVTRGDIEGLRASIDLVRSSGSTLERYAKRLHEPNGAGLSLYSAETQRLALENTVPGLLPVPEHLVQRGQEELIDRLRQLLRRLPEFADPAFPGPDAPWSFVRADSVDGIDFRAVAGVAAAIEDAGRGLTTADDSFSRAARAATSADELAALAAAARAGIDSDLIDEVRSERWRSAYSELERDVASLAAGAAPSLSPATPAVLDLPLTEIHARAKAAAESSWFGRKKRQRAVIAELADALIPGTSLHPKELLGHAANWLQLQGALRQLAAGAHTIPGIRVPDQWNPLADGGMDVVKARARWLREMSDLADPDRHSGAFAPALREFLRRRETVHEDAIRSVEMLADGFARLPELVRSTPGDLTNWAGRSGLVDRWLATGARRDPRDPTARSLDRWITLRNYLLPLAHAKMGEAYSLLLTGKVLSSDAIVALERGIAAASLAERRRAQGLDAFDADAHQRVVTRFVSASSDVRTLLKDTLPVSAIRRRTFEGTSLSGQVGRLKRELSRQRGGMSVRDLMANFGGLITEIMPCVLVSPDSVARFLPVGSQAFDIVVFDEASQIRVADAVGAIGRGRSVVVVGDSKQMPPTSFAEVSWRPDQDDDADDSFDEAVEDEESILSECVQARVPRQWLTWHYRSHDESLIAFSNAHYYDGKLSSFPAPTVGDADPSVNGHGINLVRVDGKFLRSAGGKLKRTNPVEAEAIVAEIRKRFDLAPAGTAPSIGVVTFNQQQRAYIEALIRDSGDDRLVQALESTGQNGLFIKNLENVQGDERDVILFSTAFSVNERGVLPLNFGPLNRAGGERRLNVAITRARRQVILYSSFDPSALRAEETSSLGIKHLRAYLDVAAHGTGTLGQAVGRTLNVDRHREDIAERLRARGLTVTTDVGLSDFRVDVQIASPSDPSQPIAAVLLDGPLWANRLTVSDRDGMPVDVLCSAMQWPVVERVWLPEWLESPDKVVDRIAGAVHGARRYAITQEVDAIEVDDEAEDAEPQEDRDPNGPSAPAAPRRAADADVELTPMRSLATAPAVSPAAVVAATVRPPENRRTFTPWQPGIVGYQEQLNYLGSDRRVARELRELLRLGIEAEGPIHGERLAKFAAGAFCLQRVAPARVHTILAVSPSRPDSSGFYWPSGVKPAEWLDYREDSRAQRPLEHISEVELANAMRELTIASGGMDQEELWSETLRVFGYKRRTPAFVARLENGLRVAVQLKRVSLGQHGLYQGTR